MKSKRTPIAVKDIKKTLDDYYKQTGLGRKLNPSSVPKDIQRLQEFFKTLIRPPKNELEMRHRYFIDKVLYEEKPVLNEKQLFELATILLNEKTHKGHASYNAISSLKQKFQEHGAKLDVYDGLKSIKCYDEETVSALYHCDEKQVVTFVRSLKLLRENDIQPKDYDIHALHHSHFNTAINKLKENKLLKKETVHTLSNFDKQHEKSATEFVDCLVTLNTQKQYSQLNRPYFKDLLHKYSHSAKEILTYYFHLQEEKMLNPEVTQAVDNLILRSKECVFYIFYSDHEKYSSPVIRKNLESLKKLQQIHLLDSKNIVPFCKILSEFPSDNPMLSIFEAKENFSGDVKEDKQDLEEIINLFSKYDKDEKYYVQMIIKHYNTVNHKFLSFLEIKKLLKEKKETIRKMSDILREMSNCIQFYQEDIFDKIRIHANTIHEILQSEAISSSQIKSYLQVILRMPYLQASLTAFSAFLRNPEEFKKSELIEAFMKSPEYKKNNFTKDFILLLKEANKFQVKFQARQWGRISVLTAFERANRNNALRHSILPLISSCLPKDNKFFINELKEELKLGINKFISSNAPLEKKDPNNPHIINDSNADIHRDIGEQFRSIRDHLKKIENDNPNMDPVCLFENMLNAADSGINAILYHLSHRDAAIFYSSDVRDISRSIENQFYGSEKAPGVLPSLRKKLETISSNPSSETDSKTDTPSPAPRKSR